jgi:hypothetical protein
MECESMTPPRPKKHNSATDRTAASRARRESEGQRQINIWLSSIGVIEKLDYLVEKRGAASRGELIESLIMKAR